MITEHNYYRALEECGDNYKQVIDECVKENIPYDKIIRSIQFLNESKYNAFIYFYDTYLCRNCKKTYEKKILRILAQFPPSIYMSKNINNDMKFYRKLLEELFSEGLYPDQVCMDKSKLCKCKCDICHITEDCKCEYHCSETSFAIACGGTYDYNKDFIELGLKYIDINCDSVLFKNGVINKTLLKKYISRLNSSYNYLGFEKNTPLHALKLFYNFYVKYCDSNISFNDFCNANFDNIDSSCCRCVVGNKQDILNQIKKLEDDLLKLKNKI